MKPLTGRASVSSHHTEEAVDINQTMTNFSLDLRAIRLIWIVAEATSTYSEDALHDVELSFTRISLTVQKQNEARLSIQNLQLQAVPKHHPGFDRAENSALLPEIVFTVGYGVVSEGVNICLLYTSPSPRDGLLSRMPSSA